MRGRTLGWAAGLGIGRLLLAGRHTTNTLKRRHVAIHPLSETPPLTPFIPTVAGLKTLAIEGGWGEVHCATGKITWKKLH